MRNLRYPNLFRRKSKRPEVITIKKPLPVKRYPIVIRILAGRGRDTSPKILKNLGRINLKITNREAKLAITKKIG
ncbi:MAG: hypothetical protein NZ942_03435 [Candidatus Aenigmarchaeota archaeon]|nr:hypothetical protein [Candidatus Aenigmarchaeota archaeon]